MELFYDPDFKGEGILCEPESKHCINVLRHKAGDIITIANGDGSYFKCRITEAHHKRCKLTSIDTIQHKKPDYKVHLAVAPTKSIDRFEWLIEKAVEMGIHEITPLLCAHSERKKLRIDRVERIAISAMKQSLKAYMPIVNDLTTFQDFIKKIKSSQTYLAHCYDEEKTPLKNAYQLKADAVLCIGPEGDFSIDEVKLAKEHGCHMVSLGTSRLRTETAGIAACHTIHLLNE